MSPKSKAMNLHIPRHIYVSKAILPFQISFMLHVHVFGVLQILSVRNVVTDHFLVFSIPSRTRSDVNEIYLENIVLAIHNEAFIKYFCIFGTKYFQ